METPKEDPTKIDLEVKLAYLEKSHGELNQVVYKQARELDSLKQRVAGLLERIQVFEAKQSNDLSDTERPPHY